MKTISVNVSEPVYQDFLEYARRTDRTAAELIREAMELFRAQRIAARSSIKRLSPLDLGEVIGPLNSEEENVVSEASRFAPLQRRANRDGSLTF